MSSDVYGFRCSSFRVNRKSDPNFRETDNLFYNTTAADIIILLNRHQLPHHQVWASRTLTALPTSRPKWLPTRSCVWSIKPSIFWSVKSRSWSWTLSRKAASPRNFTACELNGGAANEQIHETGYRPSHPLCGIRFSMNPEPLNLWTSNPGTSLKLKGLVY